MAVTVVLPGYLQSFAGGRSAVDLEGRGRTVAELLTELERSYPGVVARVITERRELRQHVNIFVDGENVKESAGLGLAVKDGSEVVIVPAVSGG